MEVQRVAPGTAIDVRNLVGCRLEGTEEEETLGEDSEEQQEGGRRRLGEDGDYQASRQGSQPRRYACVHSWAWFVLTFFLVSHN